MTPGQVGRTPERLGRYTLLRPLGVGGMAELFLARADGIEGFTKLVALKRILPHKATNDRFVRMFLDEARLVAGLDHPNIAQVYDIGQENGDYFFAMEYVHGPDLQRIIRVAPQHRLALENVLHVAIGLCAGLHRAHEARDESGRSLEIVHRDVSPSNVLVSYQGSVKLVDFGVAKAASIVSETREGVIKGKYGYMSPEQCLGEPLTRQSDVFNVGILLWEMMVGRRLYKVNGDLVTLQRIVYVDAPRPSRYLPDLPAELERIVMRALARDPAKRYRTTEQLQLELEAFALEHRIPVSSVSMGLEMRQLFRERVEAWQAAQEAGRSLADHLVEISSDHAVSSEDGDVNVAGIDDVIADLDTVALHDRFAEEPSDVVDTPTHLERPQPRGAEPPEAPRSSEIRATTTRAPAPVEAIAAPPVSTSDAIAPRPKPRRLAVIGLMITAATACGVVIAWRTREPDPVSARAELPIATLAIDTTSPPTEPATQPEPAIVAMGSSETGSAEAGTGSSETGSSETGSPETELEPDADHSKPARPPSREKRTRRPAKPPASARLAVTAPDPEPVKEPVKEPVQEPVKEPVKPPVPTELDKLPRVDAGPPPGTVDPKGVRTVARAHLGEIETCVSRARMENRDLSGRVVIQVNLSPAGRVTGTSIAKSTGASPSLEACMMKTVTAWTFPAPTGGVRGAFTYPFTF